MPERFKKGDTVWYSPIMMDGTAEYAGVVETDPWKLGHGDVVMHVHQMDDAYFARFGKRRVQAAYEGALRHRDVSTPLHPDEADPRGYLIYFTWSEQIDGSWDLASPTGHVVGTVRGRSWCIFDEKGGCVVNGRSDWRHDAKPDLERYMLHLNLHRPSSTLLAILRALHQLRAEVRGG
jgi:hypothetical protein